MSMRADASAYLEHLPALYQEDPLLGKFLEGFRVMLEGGEGSAGDVEGIGQKIDRVAQLFDPQHLPSAFLNWLASWMALTLREDWEEPRRRDLIREIVSLYPLRGTRKGLERYIKLYAGDGVTVRDHLAPMRVGQTSRVGTETVLGGMPPHFFVVNVRFSEADRGQIGTMTLAVKAVVDAEKPAHTYYDLNTQGASMVVGVVSTVGKDTII